MSREYYWNYELRRTLHRSRGAGDWYIEGRIGGENMLASYNRQVRYFTVREAARLQTFPDDYFFHHCWTQTMRQMGNAVPVSLAEAIASDMRAQLETILQNRV